MVKLISSPSIIESAGNKPKIIREYIGQINSNTKDISLAHMISPKGWEEPGQRPEFHEYTLVLKGELSVQTKKHRLKVKPGQAIVTDPGEWIKYDTKNAETEYIAVCLPAFSIDTVHRDKDE